MPPERIPLLYTNRFRLETAEAYLSRPFQVSAREFARAKGLNHATVLSWVAKIDNLRETERPGALTLGGSGRRPLSLQHEDILLTQIKDLRRQRLIVTRAMIVFIAQELMPTFFEDKTIDAALCWCARIMRRNRLTLRRVTTRGQATREFCDEVRRVIVESVVPLNPEVDPRMRVFNMDQTAIFASAISLTTVDKIGVRVVPALTAGTYSQRITMALLVRADGMVIPPHFVFKGKPGGDVEKEMQSCVPHHVATCSVQENAWFDERVMLEWIEHSFRPNVVGYSVLLLDTLKTHKVKRVQDELGDTGTSVHYVPPGCTGVAQPLDVGVMSPLKSHMRLNCAQAAFLNRLPENSVERRRYMFDQAMLALAMITPDTVRHSFDKAGPHFGCTTSTDVQDMLDEASLLNVTDAQDNDSASVQEVIAGEVQQLEVEVISV